MCSEDRKTLAKPLSIFSYGDKIPGVIFTADFHAAKGGAIEDENGYTGNSYP
jgi:hypothetical protein